MHIFAKATRDFCPPDKLAMLCNANCPDMPKLPNCRRYSSSGRPGKSSANTPTQVVFMFR